MQYPWIMAWDDLKQRLRAGGLRVTASRLAVMRLLSDARRPLSHQDVVESLSEMSWNRSTLYRNLVDLVDASLARRTVIAGLARFEWADHAVSCLDHPHFVCTDCGSVSHLEGVSIRIEGHPVPPALTRKGTEVQLRGQCDGCHRAQRSTSG